MSELRKFTVVPPPAELTAVLVMASSIEPSAVDWLAYGYLAAGKLTILDGDPGLGKSTIAIDWAAKVTRGEGLFDAAERRPPRGVVLISDEDDRADTIRPRLEAAGADLSKVALMELLSADGETLIPEFPRDGDALAAAIEEVDAGLVIIDPLMLYLGADINSNRDSEVRRALNPIIKAAQATGASILVLRHFTKGGGPNALYRGGGSIGIIGAARIGLMVARDLKTDESGASLVLAPFKNNLAPWPPSRGYQLVSAPGGQVATIQWTGVIERSADALLDTDERSQRDEAMEFLAGVLAGGPVQAADIRREANGAGISWRTIERAKADLRIRSVKNGFSGAWAWALPEKPERPHASPPRPSFTVLSTTTYVCRDCGLPRSRDTRPCPQCGATDGVEK